MAQPAVRVPAPSPTTATRVRYKVLTWCVLLAAVTYMDRVCISVTAPGIMNDLGLSDTQMGLVFSAFTLAYGAFEIPTGWWGDRVGTRRVLTRIVTWWSSFTILTAAAFNYYVLLAIRFLFGAGEAGAWPNVARTLSRWFPATERGSAQGIFFTGAHGGAALTPILVTFMLGYMHWRWIFVIFGFVGFIWAIGWWRWYRDDPAEHPEVSAAELKYIEAGRLTAGSHSLKGVPWRRIFGSRNVPLLCLMYFTQTYGFYFFITWLPTYLARERGFSAMGLGFFAALPMIFCVIADVTGGLATDRLSRAYGLRIGRAVVGGASFLFAGASMLAGTAAQDPKTAAVLLALAAGWSTFCLGPAWGTCLDIAGHHAGVVSACMNTAGQVGGMLSPVILGLAVQYWANWSVPLYVTGLLFLIGGLCWAFIDPRQRIEAGAEAL